MGTGGRFAGVLVTAQVWLAGVAPPVAAAEPVAAPGVDDAESARRVGDLRRYRAALREQVALRPGGPAQAELDRIAREYSEVQLIGPTSLSWLLPAGLSDEALACIAFARSQLALGDFSGLLPVGRYEVGPQALEVRGGEDLHLILRESVHPQVAPTCGPCCHGGCPEQLVGPSLPPERPEPAPAEGQPKW
jgi:hypothetical protein